MKSQIMSGDEALALVLESARNQEDPRWVLHGNKGIISENGHFDSSAIIEKSYSVDPRKWFSVEKKKLSERYNESWNESEFIGRRSSSFISREEFTIHMESLSKKPLEKAVVTQYDLKNSWEIFAIHGYGGWNNCPYPEVQCAVWREWQERFDAHIIGMHGATIEAVVMNPPVDRESCMALAWEHCLYCDELPFDRGVDTLSDLASQLANCENWRFWWD